MISDYELEAVTFREIPALFTSLRIKREDIPQGMYRYELREAEGKICQLAKHIFVDHFGTLLTTRPIQLPMFDCFECSPEDLDFDVAPYESVQDFLKKHPSVPDDTIRWFKATLEDTDLFYSQSKTADISSGCIGHLRGDFFHCETLQTTWWPHRWDWKHNNDRFKEDLKRVMEWLQSNYAPLQSLESLEAFCRRQNEFGLPNQGRGACGVRIETLHYRYMLRCLPQKGDYNVYLYCYSKEVADKDEVK